MRCDALAGCFCRTWKRNGNLAEFGKPKKEEGSGGFTVMRFEYRDDENHLFIFLFLLMPVSLTSR